jgi:hypothetical protein
VKLGHVALDGTKVKANGRSTNQTVGNRGGGGGGGGPAKPKAKAQRNFTDPESRILKTDDGFIQGYNKRSVDLRRDDVVRDDDLMDP